MQASLSNQNVQSSHQLVVYEDYRALCVCFTHDLIDSVDADQPTPQSALGVQLLRAYTHHPADILSLIQDSVENNSLPKDIRVAAS